MKIVLLQSVRGLGDPGDIVNVKSGYANIIYVMLLQSVIVH